MRFFKSSHRGPACRQTGFTLIELLVVMAVMSILVGVGINTFSIAQKKARDAKRKADLRTLKTALEAYKLSTGVYPTFNNGVGNVYGEACLGDGTHTLTNFTQYLSSYPTDPKHPGACTVADTQPCYMLMNSGVNFTIYAKLEDTQDKDATTAKPAPIQGPTGSSSDGNVTFTIGAGFNCAGKTFNYWINSES